MTDVFEALNPPEDLWLRAIRRVFKSKAAVWYRDNKDEFRSWSKFKKLFKDRFIGLLDEDDLYDELRIRLQIKTESIDDFIGIFKHMVSRLRHQPPLKEQLKIVYKNLLPQYRQYINGRHIDSFRTLIKWGREWEKEKRIDERQSNLNGRKTDKVSAIQEIEGELEKKSPNNNKKGGKKGRKPPQTEVEHDQAEIAAVDANMQKATSQKQNLQAKQSNGARTIQGSGQSMRPRGPQQVANQQQQQMRLPSAWWQPLNNQEASQIRTDNQGAESA